MSQEATSRRADSGITSAASGIHPSSSSSSSTSSSSSSSDDSGGVEYGSFSDFFQEYMWDFIIGDPMEHRIEAQIEDQVLHAASASRATRRQEAARREEERAGLEALRQESARGRKRMRKLREYSDMLGADVSGYTEAQLAERERELDHRSRELFGSGSGGGN